MLPLLAVTFHLIGLVSSIHSIMFARTAQGSIAWAVSLNTFPYFAVPAYWMFGRSKFQGYVDSRRKANAENRSIRDEVRSTVQQYRVPEGEQHEETRVIEGLAGIPVLAGNRVDLLIDGEDTFESILRGIDEAKEYILIQFYMVHDDDLGKRLKDHLLAKAHQGLRIYFLYDGVGSLDLPSSYETELREAGVEIHEFEAQTWQFTQYQLNFRNHRKIVVTDGRIAWIGGHNVGDEYLGKDPEIGHWRDTHVRIEGPAVLRAQSSFLEDWFWVTSECPTLDWSADPASDGSDAHALVLPTGPADEVESANLMFVHAINSAQDRIWIASPYFVPDHSVVVALQLAGLRGADVRILIPDRADSLLVHLAGYSYLDQASRTGLKFYRYLDGFLHEKALLIDDDVAMIGTANLDNRSFRLNFEITVAVYDADFAAKVEKMFEKDFELSREMAEGEYGKKPWWFRLGVRLARLTAPIQ